MLWDGERLVATKLPTDPAARERVVVEGTLTTLEAARLNVRELSLVVHGTTAATNAVLQRRGGRVALVTNRGFEDAIEIGRQNRPRLYDLAAVRPEPLVERRLRFAVRGRLDRRGRELRPLDERELSTTAERVARAGVDAVAVSLLHSYASPRHEKRVVAALRAAGLTRVSPSHEVDPEFREFERTSTTVVNAFLLPVFEGALKRLESSMREKGSRAPLVVMESDGGMVGAATAQVLPVRTVLSGPAGGVAAGAAFARLLKLPAALTLDMGGTSTDIAAIVSGKVGTRAEAEVAGFPIRVPMLDIVTIGAGGGSIAEVDPGGLLGVGPTSAEAWPGPVCYSRGGTKPTVTDADVCLGRIDAVHFLGGRMKLRPDLALKSMAPFGERLGLGPLEAASAVVEVATTNLQHGIRLATTERGLDPRDFTLLPFGGAGPLHAVEAARELGIKRVIVPPSPSVFSAWGMLVAPVRHTVSATVMVRQDARGLARALRVIGRLKRDCLGRIRGEGFARRRVRTRVVAALRYVGQSYELEVPVRSAGAGALAAACRAFHAHHHRAFGHSDARRPLEVVAIRVAAEAPPPARAKMPRIATGGSSPEAPAREGERRVWFVGSGWRRSAVWSREGLLAGNVLSGPAIVEGGDHTVLVPPASTLVVGLRGELEVTG